MRKPWFAFIKYDSLHSYLRRKLSICVIWWIYLDSFGSSSASSGSSTTAMGTFLKSTVENILATFRSSCPDPSRSPLFLLCESMILIFLIQVCLPCLLTLALLPVVCFCLPCFIRILAWVHDPIATEGANEAAINNLKLVTVDEELLQSTSSATCPICLSDMAVGDQARFLPCNHFFHKHVFTLYCVFIINHFNICF